MRPEILFPLFAPIASLKGVGPRIAPLLEKLAGPIVRDLLFLTPQGLIVRTPSKAAQAIDGAVETFEVEVDRHLPSGKIGAPYKIRVRDETGFIHIVYFKGIGSHLAKNFPVGAKLIISGRVERYGAEVQIPHPAYVLPVAP
jgi:ATP-dependent DNA helicase RecG